MIAPPADSLLESLIVDAAIRTGGSPRVADRSSRRRPDALTDAAHHVDSRPVAAPETAPPPRPPVVTTRAVQPPLLRKDGEWPRVNLSKLDPAAGAAFQRLCEEAVASAGGAISPMEEFDALRALKARGLSVPRALDWLRTHRAWWEKEQPRDRLRYGRDPGVRVQLASGMARWMALDKRGVPYFYGDLERWAPHLSSCEDHTKFTVVGLELMREAGRQFGSADGPDGPVYGAVIDIRCWAVWHAGYMRHILAFFTNFLYHYPQCLDRIYLLNAPKLFAQAWKIIRRVLDQWTRERIDFVTDDEIAAGYFLERFDAASLYTTLGGARDAAELHSTNVPGFFLQPGTEVEPELVFDWKQTPLPPAIAQLRAEAKAQARAQRK